MDWLFQISNERENKTKFNIIFFYFEFKQVI